MAPRTRGSARSGSGSRSPSPARPSSAPEQFVYEFGGPVGAVATMVALPCVILGLYLACDPSGCVPLDGLVAFVAGAPAALDAHAPLLTAPALQATAGWLAFQAALERLLPAETAEGVLLADGTRLRYRLNGFRAFVATLLLLLGLQPFPLEAIHDQYLPLAVASIAISTLLSVYLYAASFGDAHDGVSRLLARGGQSGVRCYDFFMGRELNPRLGGADGFDLKVFCELRPGLIGWVVINLAMCAKQQQLHGAVSPEMISVNVFQGLYVADALYNERAILSTMDITTDGFGFMLAFGDLAWVPFTYSLQARYLTHHSPGLPEWQLALIWALNFGGYALFRLSNGEKDAFRRDPSHPSVAHLRSIQTKRGTRLLTSGYWGMARKINYTADWMMGLSWCLTCGFGSIIPYFYSIYFGILLVHRAWRDDEACQHKYGKDWQRYKKAVPYVFIPGVI